MLVLASRFFWDISYNTSSCLCGQPEELIKKSAKGKTSFFIVTSLNSQGLILVTTYPFAFY